MWSLLVAVASADPSVEAGWALYRVGSYADSAALAAGVLEQDPGAIAWQRLYARSRARIDGDGAVIGQYRAWHARAPDDPVRRLLLADTLGAAWRFDASWCDEIQGLLGVTPTDPDTRLWTHLVRASLVGRRCGADPGLVAQDIDQALALADGVPEALGPLVSLVVSDGISTDDVGRIRDALAAEPMVLGRLVDVFGSEGPGARKVQKLAERAARAATDADLPRLQDAVEVLEAAGIDAGAAERRLAALHPDPHRFGFARDVSRARRHADPLLALSRVEALGTALPDDPELVARYHTARGDLLRKAGRLDEATAAYRDAWQATPDHADRANWFAYHAALMGTDLERALEAADVAVRGAMAERFADRSWPGETFAEWRESSARRVGEALDSRAWTLHLLGRDAEAVADALQATRLVDIPVVDLHAGLVLTAIGEADAAAVHLARGTAERDPAERETVDRGWTALRAWWPEAGIWHPAGLEGWVGDISGTAPPVQQLSDPSALVGQRLPDVPLRVGGQTVTLADVQGPAVIDVWATWCRPCVEALPEVERLAGQYPEVHFLAVSVDDEESALRAYFAGASPPTVPLGWWSSDASPFELLGIAGVPSVFVIDAEQRVAAYLLGADVNRLGAAVEAVARDAR